MMKRPGTGVSFDEYGSGAATTRRVLHAGSRRSGRCERDPLRSDDPSPETVDFHDKVARL
jgi:hypothetical protein